MDKLLDGKDLQAKIDGDFTIIRQNANVAIANAEWFRLKIYNWDMTAISKTFLELQGYDVIKREPELKPCPNPECGETNPLNLYVFPEEDGSCYITCDTCGYNSPYGDTEAEAIRLHNLIAEKAK